LCWYDKEDINGALPRPFSRRFILLPFEDQQKRFANSMQVINRSDSDDLNSSEIKIEVRIQGLYNFSNYVPNIEHLPGVIEVNVLDSFKILSRRLGRVTDNAGNPKGATVSTEKFRLPKAKPTMNDQASSI
jgi:hypothetical protein